MKKILMVSCEGLARGGIQAVMMGIVRHFKSEYQFDMLLFTEEERYYDKEFLSYGGTIIRVPFYEGNNPLRRKLDFYTRKNRLYRSIAAALRKNGPYEVIHCNNSFESGLCLKAAAKAGIPIRIVQSHVCEPQYNKVRTWINRSYLRLIETYATDKIACTPEAGKSLFGKDSSFSVVHNFYDQNRFDPDRYTKANQRALVLTQIGSYSPNKNQLFSLQILKELLTIGTDVHLHFVGFGEYQSTIQAEIQKLGLQNRITFHPADADTPALLNQSAAFLFPSFSEGFGIVLIEAQAMGVRCYVSDTVPQGANVGGCTYLPLSAGAKAWAEKIHADYCANGGAPAPFDCTAFSEHTIMDTFKRLYEGEHI